MFGLQTSLFPEKLQIYYFEFYHLFVIFKETGRENILMVAFGCRDKIIS